MIIKTTPFQKTNVLIAVVLLGALIFVVFVILPIFGQIQKSADRLAAAWQEESALRDQIAAAQDYKKISEEVRGSMEDLGNMFVDIQFPVDFIRFLENLAQEHNLSVEISSPSEMGEGGYATFQLTLRGASPDLTRFIARLETGQYLVQVQQMRVQGLGQGGVSSNIFLRVLVK